MSKQRKPKLLALFLLLALFVGLFLTSAGLAQRTPGPQQNPLATRSARNAALVAATATVLKETSEIRQLAVLRPVPSSTQSRAEIERMIVKNLDEDTTPADIHADEVALKKLGMAPPDFQYRPFLIKLLTEQVAGYYDPKVREFYLADWIDLDGQKPIMAHELTHALQDQHFNLRRFEHWPKGDSDAELAAHSLVEGDATLAMMLYVANDALRAVAFMKSLSATGAAYAELEKAPRALRETLLFPYQEGADWSRNLYKEGGWPRVSKAFTELPQSSEQILHPEKYFAHEAPVKITMPDITGLLNASSGSGDRRQGLEVGGQGSVFSTQTFAGSADILSAFSGTSMPPAVRVSSPTLREGKLRNAPVGAGSTTSLLAPVPQPLPPSWKKIDYDVQGEWGFFLLLDQFLKGPAESRRAAAGWGGDRYEVYEGPNGEVLIASLSSWDTERDAREFFDAYVKRTELRYPGAERLVSPTAADPTPNSKLETQNSYSWRTSEGTVVVECRGTRCLVVEGLAEQVNLKALLTALWR